MSAPLGIAGAGAFCVALAVALAQGGRDIRLWGRDPGLAARRESLKLPGVALPKAVTVAPDLADLAGCDAVLLAMPMQSLAGFLAAEGRVLRDCALVACCKGLDLATLEGPAEVIVAAPVAAPEVLEALGRLADRVVCLRAPPGFTAVGRHYASFPQLDDTEVQAILAGRPQRGPTGCCGSRPAASPNRQSPVASKAASGTYSMFSRCAALFTFLGRVSVSTPLSYLALACAASTSAGS